MPWDKPNTVGGQWRYYRLLRGFGAAPQNTKKRNACKPRAEKANVFEILYSEL
jgi:hypothetical protein